MAKSQGKTCIECGGRIMGRADKKFCSDTCRIAWNNRLNSNGNNYMRNVNNILRRNRRILEGLNPGGKTRVTRDKMAENGYNFKFFTNIYTTKEGATYFFCYEQGYLEVEKNIFLLVVKKG